MMRAHLVKTVREGNGPLITPITVHVMKEDASGLITDTLFADQADTNDVFSNPYVPVGGVIDFYLDAPQRVSLKVVTYDGQEFFYNAVDVLNSERVLDPYLIQAVIAPGDVVVADHIFKPGLLIPEDGSIVGVTLFAEQAPDGDYVDVHVTSSDLQTTSSPGEVGTFRLPDGQRFAQSSLSPVPVSSASVLHFAITHAPTGDQVCTDLAIQVTIVRQQG